MHGFAPTTQRRTTMFNKLLRTQNDPAVFVLRVLLGVVFFPHGAQKVLGWFGGYGFSGTMTFFTQNAHIPALFAFLAIMAEFLGSLGLITGLLTRVAAFGIGCNMFVAATMVHAPFGFFMNWFGNQKGEGIEYHILALAIVIALMIKGGGSFSLDMMISKRQLS
jgi:putative oxidoreductase